jgi:DNA-binding NarL/FixJ family response regulator
MTARAPSSGLLLAGEREALTRFPLSGAIDARLGSAAERSGDAASQLRIASYELLAGRDADARQRVARSGNDPAHEPQRRAILLLTDTWAGRVVDTDLAIPPPVRDDTPSALLELAAIAFARLCDDGDGTGHTWAQQSAISDRLEQGTRSWLAAAGNPEEFIAGLPAAIHAAGILALSERCSSAVDILGHLARRARRYGLFAWIAILEFFQAFALQHLGEYDRARRLVVRSLPGLRRDPDSPWLAFALAVECFVASLDTPTVDLQPLERELFASAWRIRRPIVAHTGIHRMAAGLAEVGDAVGARRILAVAGPLEDLRLVNEDRVRAYEIAIDAAIAEGDRATAEALAQRVARLMASTTQVAALARIRVRLGSSGDPVDSARAAATAIERLRARWTTLASALARGDRDDALDELAALDAVAADLRATAVRVGAVRFVHEGPRPIAKLTPRQREVAALAASGLSNRQIAARLYLGVRTVETHLAAALRALGLRRRSDLGRLRSATRPGDPAEPEHGVWALTVRQGQVAALIAAGCTNAQIARTLRVSAKAVEKHVAAIKATLGAPSRTAIAAAFFRAGRADIA